jgi:hypothetical protein
MCPNLLGTYITSCVEWTIKPLKFHGIMRNVYVKLIKEAKVNITLQKWVLSDSRGSSTCAMGRWTRKIDF